MQPEDAEEKETNPSIPQQKEQADTKDGEVIANYRQDVDYKPEGLDNENKQDAQEGEENSNAKNPKMELLQQWKIHQWSMNSRVVERIEQVHQA